MGMQKIPYNLLKFRSTVLSFVMPREIDSGTRVFKILIVFNFDITIRYIVNAWKRMRKFLKFILTINCQQFLCDKRISYRRGVALCCKARGEIPIISIHLEFFNKTLL